MNQTINLTKEQITEQYFSKLEKFEERLEAADIETGEYYELLDLFRAYTMIDVKEEHDPNVRVVVLDDLLERTVLEGVMISPSSALVITEGGRREMMNRLEAGTLSGTV